MKIKPKTRLNHQKCPAVMIIPTSARSRSWLLQYLLLPAIPAACLWNSVRLDYDLKIVETTAWKSKSHETQTSSLLQSTRNTGKTGSLNQKQIDEKPALDPKVSFLLLIRLPKAASTYQSDSLRARWQHQPCKYQIWIPKATAQAPEATANYKKKT